MQKFKVRACYLYEICHIQKYACAGMRGFELDVLEDPMPGKYAYSAGLKLAGQNSLVNPDLLKPGLKVGSL